MRVQFIIIVCLLAALAIAVDGSNRHIIAANLPLPPSPSPPAPFFSFRNVVRVISEFWESILRFFWPKNDSLSSPEAPSSDAVSFTSAASAPASSPEAPSSNAVSFASVAPAPSPTKDTRWDYIRNERARERTRKSYDSHVEKMKKVREQKALPKRVRRQRF